MEPHMWFVLALLVIAIVFGPKYGAESRQGYKDVNVKPRPNSGPSDWRSPY
jgi:hypothetical protein